MRKVLQLAILLILCYNSLVAQIKFPPKETSDYMKQFGVNYDTSLQKFKTVMETSNLIIRGNLLYGDNWKKVKDEKTENVLRTGLEDAGNIYTHKYLQINEVLRGDTTLKGKIIELVVHTGFFDRTGIINAPDVYVRLPQLNDRYQEYFFLKKSNFKNLLSNIKIIPFEFTVNRASVGNYDESYKDYNFDFFAADEKSLFEEIIKTKNYNPKFMLEAGMKLPEKEKKDVGFSVVEIEEPNNLRILANNDLTVKIINKQNTNANQYLEFDIQVKAASNTTYSGTLYYFDMQYYNSFFRALYEACAVSSDDIIDQNTINTGMRAGLGDNLTITV